VKLKPRSRSIMQTANWTPATVLDINGPRVTVRLSSTATILRNLDVTGETPTVGADVYVDLTAKTPRVIAFATGFPKPLTGTEKAYRNVSRAGNVRSASSMMYFNPPTMLTGIIVDNGPSYEPQTFPCSDAGFTSALAASNVGGVIYIPGGTYTQSWSIYPGRTLVGMSPGSVIFTGTLSAGSGCVLESIYINHTYGGSSNIVGLYYNGEVILKNCDIRVTRTSGVGYTTPAKAGSIDSVLIARECGFYSNGDGVWGNHTGSFSGRPLWVERDVGGVYDAGRSWLFGNCIPNVLHPDPGYGKFWTMEPKGLGFESWHATSDGSRCSWYQPDRSGIDYMYWVSISGAQEIYEWRIVGLRNVSGQILWWELMYKNYSVAASKMTYFGEWYYPNLALHGHPLWTHVNKPTAVVVQPGQSFSYEYIGMQKSIYGPANVGYLQWTEYIQSSHIDIASVWAHIRDSEGQDWQGIIWTDGLDANGNPTEEDDWDKSNIRTEMYFYNCIFGITGGHPALRVGSGSIAYLMNCEIPTWEGNVQFLPGDQSAYEGWEHV